MYTVYGFTDDCQDFSLQFDSFVKAVKKFRSMERWCTVFFKREKPGTCMFVKGY